MQPDKERIERVLKTLIEAISEAWDVIPPLTVDADENDFHAFGTNLLTAIRERKLVAEKERHERIKRV